MNETVKRDSAPELDYSALHWFAVYTKSRHEKKVRKLLDEKKIENYLPLIKEYHQWSDRKKLVEVPLIRGYVFVRIAAKNSVYVLEVPGAVRFIKFKNELAPIPDFQIEALSRVIASGVSFRPREYLKTGQMVQVSDGPLKGIKGKIQRIENETRFRGTQKAIPCINTFRNVTMATRFFNTMTRKKEEFQPLQAGTVRMYTCGPTVYNFAHIGNFRAYVFEDLLRRYLKFKGYKVVQVMNITDVDDKIIRDANKASKSIGEFTKIYREAFFEDLDALGIERAEVYPAATDHIPEMVNLIKAILAKGIAYRTEDGSIYFRVSDYPAYGRLAHLNVAEGAER